MRINSFILLFVLLVHLNTAIKTLDKNEVFNGITFVGDKYCPEVSFEDELAIESLNRLKNTGANWVAIVVTEYQDYRNSTEIRPFYKDFPTNDYFIYKTETLKGIRKVVEHSKKIGLKVMLKPHIDLSQEKDYFVYWRGNIGEPFTTDEEWTAWFTSYEKFIIKYAKLAEELEAEMFSVSCELIAVSKQTKFWRPLIQKIRNVYSGPLTDSANHDGEEYSKEWWDTMDYIGIDAYYLPIKVKDMNLGTDEEKVVKFLEEQLKLVKNLAKKHKKPVIITEIGFCSGNCARNETATKSDQNMQKFYYEKFIEIYSKSQIIKGFFWWAWNTDPYFGGAEDTCISPQYKESERILRKFYGGNDNMDYTPAKSAKCKCTI